MSTSIVTPSTSTCPKVCLASATSVSLVSGITTGVVGKIVQGWNKEEDRWYTNIPLSAAVTNGLFLGGLQMCEWICSEGNKVSEIAQETINENVK